MSCSLYGITLVLQYLFSSLYHSSHGPARRILQKLDHVAIYLLIAGTCTPFTLITLRGPLGWSLFTVVWGLAIIGILQDVLFIRRRGILSVVIYLLMGWIAVVAIGPLRRLLPSGGMAWLVAGGISYTAGVVFYALKGRLTFSHEIVHFLRTCRQRLPVCCNFLLPWITAITHSSSS